MIETSKTYSGNPFSSYEIIRISLKDGSREFDFNSLLPNYWQFCQKVGERLHTDPERKRVIVPTDYFKSPGNAFSLLHEIGHAVINESKSEEDLEEEVRLRDKLSYVGIISYTATEKASFTRLVLESERAAWRFAMETYRELRQNGINLEPDMTESDLIQLAAQKLLSYQI